MFSIHIEPPELYDEANDEFITVNPEILELEHSLVSISKWESRWCKPFLAKGEKSYEESVDYIFCMTLNKVDPEIYKYISYSDVTKVTKYMEASMTATTFPKNNDKTSSEIITSEIIYYWMVALNIPFECQTWHLNRLLTLVNVVNIKQSPPKKMGKKETLSRNAQLNAARKAQMNTKG